MRFPFAALVGIVTIGLCSASFAQDRYGAAASNPSSSTNRFEDLFSKESSRGTTSPSTSSSPQGATKRGASSYNIRPLNKSDSGSGTRATAGTRNSSTPPVPSTTSDPFARSNSSRSSTTTPTTSSNSRDSRFSSSTPSYSRNQSSTTPSSTYRRGSSAPVSSAQDRFADRGNLDRNSVDRNYVDQGGRREAATQNMLSRMLKAHSKSRLIGTPMPLSSLLAGTASRDRQSQLIEAYWALTSATADYYLGLHEADELGKLRQRVPTYSTALNKALSNLNGRLDTSLKAAKAAQFHLGQLTNAGTKTLPTDTPFCGPYVTRYEEIFAGRGSEQARLLSELLPARLNELQEAAEAVERSELWLSKVAADRNGNAKGMIMALELLALNRRAFVQIAKDYNLQISRYTRLATPGDINTDRLVAMLIRTSGTPTLAGSSSIANGQSLDFRTGAASSRR